MGLLLSFFLFLFIIIVVMVISLVVRLLLGFVYIKRRVGGNKKSASSGKMNTSSPKTKQKIIPQDEGEYVDYEEVRD